MISKDDYCHLSGDARVIIEEMIGDNVDESVIREQIEVFSLGYDY